MQCLGIVRQNGEESRGREVGRARQSSRIVQEKVQRLDLLFRLMNKKEKTKPLRRSTE